MQTKMSESYGLATAAAGGRTSIGIQIKLCNLLDLRLFFAARGVSCRIVIYSPPVRAEVRVGIGGGGDGGGGWKGLRGNEGEGRGPLLSQGNVQLVGYECRISDHLLVLIF